MKFVNRCDFAYVEVNDIQVIKFVNPSPGTEWFWGRLEQGRLLIQVPSGIHLRVKNLFEENGTVILTLFAANSFLSFSQSIVS